MLDTVLLCGGGNISDWEDTPIEGPADNFIAEAYWQWIEQQLQESKYLNLIRDLKKTKHHASIDFFVELHMYY